ncbi:hypothetical protein [Roseovarius sp.]|uniref:hypothetical protein n=1 Tax=Roseovarius sp. TaxID=1486281 RepID=UPI00356B6013
MLRKTLILSAFGLTFSTAALADQPPAGGLPELSPHLSIQFDEGLDSIALMQQDTRRLGTDRI